MGQKLGAGGSPVSVKNRYISTVTEPVTIWNINLGTCCWFFAIWFFSFILILATTGAYVVLYYGFTQSPSGVTSGACTVNKWFVIGAGAACALVLVMAIIPCGDRTTTRSPTTGILQASLVSAYIMYLTFSAINAQSPVTVPLENRVQGYENVTDCVERCFHLPQQFVGWLDRVNDTQVDDLIGSVFIIKIIIAQNSFSFLKRFIE